MGLTFSHALLVPSSRPLRPGQYTAHCDVLLALLTLSPPPVAQVACCVPRNYGANNQTIFRLPGLRLLLYI